MSDMENSIKFQEEKGFKSIEDDEEEDLLVSQLNMDITNQYVVFSVGNEEYGVPILSVQEIISLPNLTRIPGVPDYIPGIINLRGNIIPLYELRRRFQMEKKDLDDNSIVIIVETGIGNKRTVGFIVDTVSDVVSITKEDISDTPEFSSSVDIEYIENIGKIGNRMIVIFNLLNFFSESEKAVIESTIKSGRN